MDEERISATVQVDDRRITLEGPRSFVEEEVRRLTSIIAGSASVPGPQQPKGADVDPAGLSERDFIELKQPSGHAEIATALGFYLAEQGQEEFSEEDIRRAYIRANVRPPKSVGQALRDAKSKRDFIKQGEVRGAYRLTQHGDRFVRFDLPPKGKR
jgi:hypothetical protein